MSEANDAIAVCNILKGTGREFNRIEDLAGMIPVKIEVLDNEEEMLIYLTDTAYARLYHEQDCCESVYIESIVGDINDLVGYPLLMVEESGSDVEYESDYESGTWTFYKFATIKGYVDVRFLGTSNGYYSEHVYFAFNDPNGEFNPLDNED